MTAFATKNELNAAYTASLVAAGRERTLAEVMTDGKAVYVPHLYRGGWVIRGFGYSTERVGVYVQANEAGNPLRA